MGIQSAALGLLLGFITQVLLMVSYPLVQRLRPSWTTSSASMAPALLGSVTLLVLISHTGGAASMLVDRYFSAQLPEGHFSCMGYAQRLMVLPQSVLYSSVLVALLPTLAARFAAGDHAEVQRAANRTLRVLMFLMVPIVCGLAVAGDLVVRLAFGRGAFGEDAIALTSLLLICYVPSMIAESIKTPVATVLLSQGRIALTISFGVLRVVLMVLTFPLVWERWGAPGLVLALGGIDVVCVAAMVAATRTMLRVDFPGMPAWSLRLGFATLAAVVTAWLGLRGAAVVLPPDGPLSQAATLAVVGAASAGVFWQASSLLGLPEGASVLKLGRSFIARKRGSP
jgi:putative peptidoglycan lipid II flippase